MKKTLLTAAVILVTALTGWSQGRVNFATAASGVNAKATDISGGGSVTPTGAAYNAQLYVAGPGISDESQFIAVGSPVPFQTAAQAGYIVAGNVAMTQGSGGVTFATTANSIISAQVRAWRVADGATFESARPAGASGKSVIIQVQLKESPTTALNLVGLQAFNLNTPVPEPSTIALGAFGMLAAWMIRRRK